MATRVLRRPMLDSSCALSVVHRVALPQHQQMARGSRRGYSNERTSASSLHSSSVHSHRCTKYAHYMFAPYRRYAECVNQQQKQNITTIQHHIQVQSALCPLRIYSSTVRVCVWGGVAIQFILDVRLVGRTGRGHTGGRSHRISHPPFFCGACLTFSREKDSVVPFPRRP